MIYLDVALGTLSGALMYMLSGRARSRPGQPPPLTWRRVPNDFNALNHVCVCGHAAHEHGSSCSVRVSSTPFGFCTCSQSRRWVRKYGKDRDLLKALKELS